MTEKIKSRHSNFSSSNIYKLCSKGRGEFSIDNVGSSFFTYVKEKKRERKLKRDINSKVHTRAITWGIVCELYVFDRKLDIKYSNMNNVGRLFHGEIENWTGIPDTFIKKDLIVGDIKCPSSLIRFCDLVDSCENGVSEFKKNHPEYYWQLVSNSILTGVNKAELLFFVPYLDELEKIYNFVDNLREIDLPDDLDLFQINFISEEIQSYLNYGKLPLSVPYLPNDSEYKPFNTFVFDVDDDDVFFLTERVKKAVEELNKG